MKYDCIICNYSSNIRCNYNRHLKTIKHIKNYNNTQTNGFNCICGKIYKSRSGLWRHKKKCVLLKCKLEKFKNEIVKIKQNNEIIISSLINTNNELIKSNNATKDYIKGNNELINSAEKLQSDLDPVVRDAADWATAKLKGSRNV